MLKLTSKNAVRFSWTDESMEALFVIKPSDSEEELVEKLSRMLAFVEERRKPPLPERTPGLALEMTQMAHPAPPGNGWASYAGETPAAPDLPEDRKGDWEMMPPEECG